MIHKDKIYIFNIKRFAVHDGPGLRTTVFVKGCSLHCPWCQNPEGISKSKNLLFHKNRCIKCYSCVNVCPKEAISISEKSGLITVNRKLCEFCGECVKTCPSQALNFDSWEVSIDVLANELLKDKIFFDESGGGVTFSGGEPLLESSFIKKVVQLLRKEEIHFAVETSLMVPESALKNIIDHIDLFIVDVKIMNQEKAKETIGIDMEQYQKNLEYLFKNNSKIICRIPLIPGYTDSNGNLHSAKKIISQLNDKYDKNVAIELINFNPLIKTKYDQLNYPVPEIEKWAKYSNSELKTFYTNLNNE